MIFQKGAHGTLAHLERRVLEDRGPSNKTVLLAPARKETSTSQNIHTHMCG
jgi:hypothetical protein